MFDINKLIYSDELHELVMNTFKDGMVPTNKVDFQAHISNEDTTDGSYCFTNIFGDDKDDVAMFFLHPLNCKIPYPYQKNFRNDEFFAMNLINLDYQLILAKLTNDEKYLQLILNEAKIVYDDNCIVSKYRNIKPADYNYAIAEMILKNENENEEEIKKSAIRYIKKFEELENFITNKLYAINYDIIETENFTDETEKPRDRK